MTTNTEWKATYHNSDPNTGYDIGDHCYNCGEPTHFGSGRFVNRLGGGWEIHTNEGKLVRVDGWWCEPCQIADCEHCNGERTHAQALEDTKDNQMGFFCDYCCGELEYELYGEEGRPE